MPEYYYQCELQQNGATLDTWLESKKVSEGKQVRLKLEDGESTDWWTILKVHREVNNLIDLMHCTLMQMRSSIPYDTPRDRWMDYIKHGDIFGLMDLVDEYNEKTSKMNEIASSNNVYELALGVER